MGGRGTVALSYPLPDIERWSVSHSWSESVHTVEGAPVIGKTHEMAETEEAMERGERQSVMRAAQSPCRGGLKREIRASRSADRATWFKRTSRIRAQIAFLIDRARSSGA